MSSEAPLPVQSFSLSFFTSEQTKQPVETVVKLIIDEILRDAAKIAPNHRHGFDCDCACSNK